MLENRSEELFDTQVGASASFRLETVEVGKHFSGKGTQDRERSAKVDSTEGSQAMLAILASSEQYS